MISVCILLFASVFVQSFKLNKFTCAKITELHNHHHSTNEIPTTDIKRANKVIQNSAIIALNVAFLSVADIAKATEMAPQDETLSIQKITKVAYLDIKIANYTEESVGTNMGAFGSGRVIIGLYGDDAPMSVQRFLETVQSDGEKLPTYLNSQFSKVSDNCLLQLNDISKLEVINIAGTEQYQYGGDILTDYKPILDTNSIRHDRRGLLTRRQLTTGPEFGITLGPASYLDGFGHVVFGIILEGLEVIESVAQVPRYTYQTSTGFAGQEKGVEGVLADKWFESQKSFYVGVGRALGDKRAIDRRGKLLRRVKIKGAGVLGDSDARKYM